MLKLNNLTKVFELGTVNEKVALDNLSCHIEKNDVVSIIGSNGSGKTTLFNMIAGTYKLTSGSIILDNKEITSYPEYKRAFEIGRIFQDPTKGTSSNMSVRDNLTLSLKKGMKGFVFSYNSEKKELFKNILSPIKLDDRLDDNVGLLSGGQRQALTLIMACLSRPKLLLLDEHTAALDPHNARVVMELTEKYIKGYQLTALMVTHNMEFAIEFGNRLIMLDEGKIILDVKGDEKKKLTVSTLVEHFKSFRNKEYSHDEALLTNS